MMIMKNQLNNVRIGYSLVVEGMEEFFKVEKELLDDHEDELEDANFTNIPIVFFTLHNALEYLCVFFDTL
jgi:hypothetical protein